MFQSVFGYSDALWLISFLQLLFKVLSFMNNDQRKSLDLMVSNFFEFLKFSFLALWLLGPNICHFDFLAFAEGICVLACAEDNNLKGLNSTINLSNLK